ncbi:diaminopimelate epimerase [Thermosulfurimonas dismutans]|uniref:Diaminopimelate epimerase n=1 Tax=Thermosulfurimonas dismutans TaxID=999894 RepID=A0A179D6T6_9BACT|nr:diaminopimelate epimerase [Thermosulfurimonas dismutans]OAQ21501.1 Diaminopimelate epimerase [Thermosulfurimonas dismutans]
MREEVLYFLKMQASGNDFILINNFAGRIAAHEGPELAWKLCRRRLSVGADGLILIEPPKKVGNAFAWRFYNADGSEAEMCGNGGRCAARFAVEEGLAKSPLVFETLAGEIRAEVSGSRVKVELTTPKDLKLGLELPLEEKSLEAHFVNTGVPHTVILVEDLEGVPVRELGRKIRYHEMFLPAGTNVNFVKVEPEGRLSIRTYERGVEDETLACGTGASAAALIAERLGLVRSPVPVKTRGGEVLIIHLEGERVSLEGEARKIYRGYLYPEALLD